VRETDFKNYFTLNEIALMSILGALIFVLKMALRMPVSIPGQTGIFWVIPVIIGVAIIKKPGSGTYIGLISGVLMSFFGVGGTHVFDIFQYTALGFAVDITGLIFSYRFDSVPIGIVVAISAGVSSVSHIIFGAIGGLISAYLAARLIKSGVITKDAE
jgi:hypothetical protein